jgi:hypothetical protein
MTSKKWIILGIVVVASLLLVATAVAGPVAQSSEAGNAQRLVTDEPGASLDIAAASPVSTSFTYQGQLTDGSGPVNDTCEMNFRLYDQVAGGNQVGSAITTTVPINDGLFTVSLNFGDPILDGTFTGAARWLEIAVQCPGDTEFTPLSPRQALTPVPYALALPGLWTQQNMTSTNLVGGYGGNSVAPGVVGATIGGGGSSGHINQATGNHATIGGGYHNTASFWATTVGGGYHNTASLWAATVGGGTGNTASGGSATVAGGQNNVTSGDYATIGGGLDNTANNWGATVGGGNANNADGESATISGGYHNTATYTGTTITGGLYNTASGENASVGGGEHVSVTGYAATVAGGSWITVTGDYAAVGGGWGNIASNWFATVAGGEGNTASGHTAAVGGGRYNTASNHYATVSGGTDNTASGIHATIGGGQWNEASNTYAIIGGGEENIASGWSATVGGGHSNAASDSYATVGGGTDNTASGYQATVGGGRFNTATYTNTTVSGGEHNTAGGYAATVPGGRYNTADGDYSFAAGRRAQANNNGCFVWGDSTDADITCSDDDRTIFRSTGGYYIYTGVDGSLNPNAGVYVSAGGGSWSSVSDRARKENFAPVDTQALLAHLAKIPISTWNYKSQAPAIRHVGPMAQDFNALLPDLGGEGETYINSLDADGVALAAIQGLYAQNQELEQQNADLEARVAALEAALANGAAPAQISRSNLLPWAGVLVAGAGLAWAFRRRNGLTLFDGGER